MVCKEEVKDIGLIDIGIQNEKITSTFDYLEKRGYSDTILKKFPTEVFSLGNISYYMEIRKVFSSLDSYSLIFKEINDIAYDKVLFNNVRNMDVISRAFFRDMVSSQVNSAYTQLNRIAHGGAKFGKFSWTLDYIDTKIHLDISNSIDTVLPKNIFAIIGNNGVGKTSLLKDIAIASASASPVLSTFLKEKKVRLINNINNDKDTVNKIVNLVFVSFSTFDIFNDDFVNAFEENKDTFKFIGNRDLNGIEHKDNLYNSIISPEYASNNFESDLEWLFYDYDKSKLFKKIMKDFVWDTSLSDFYEEVENVINTYDLEGGREEVQKKASHLSSGQKIVLSIVCNLIKFASENSLFLIDEPELYLHPPYVLGLILSIEKILEETNSICVMTTHSAISLQEISSRNVYLVSKLNENKMLMHPKSETFGTNTQTINDEIFGVDIRRTGYYNILKDIVDKYPKQVDPLIRSKQLGSDALLYLEILRENKNV